MVPGPRVTLKDAPSASRCTLRSIDASPVFKSLFGETYRLAAAGRDDVGQGYHTMRDRS